MSPPSAHISIQPATLPGGDGAPVAFELGTLSVPENRADPGSRRIDIGFARFPALDGAQGPPLFHLPGGPGSSLVQLLEPGLPRQAEFLQQLAPYRSVGDVVLVDQRGYSPRGERLIHSHESAGAPFDEPASLARSTAKAVAAAREAVTAFAAKGVDLAGYTVKDCADDVDDLRAALGYERIGLVGTSFGSQWSFAVMRRHPTRVTVALLSGVEPLDHSYDMPSQVFAGIQRIVWAAERDRDFAPHLPAGGLLKSALDFRDRVARAPLGVTVTDPETGGRVEIAIGLDDFQRDFLRGTSLPAFLASLDRGDYGAWAGGLLRRRKPGPRRTKLIRPLIDTSLGVTAARQHRLRTDPAGAVLGHWNFDADLATAPIWPSPDVGDDFRLPVSCDIPVVFAQGDWDLNTPVENTLEIAPYFPNGRVLLAIHGGHGVIAPIARHRPDVMALLLEFLKTGDAKTLPAEITLPRPVLPLPAAASADAAAPA
jgi:pimeloyl-ACP methyl ester carboxylesterase